jgi:hypothetical protein
MEDRETPRMRKYGESKTTRIMVATVPHVTSGSGLKKFQADGFLLDRVYHYITHPRCQLFFAILTLNLPTTTIVAQPFNVIKWQLNFNPVA